MAKCRNCGLLAVWNSVDLKFVEAPEHYRKEGELKNQINSLNISEPTCFIQKHDLPKDLTAGSPIKQVFNLTENVKRVIQDERNCNGFTPWLQGFSPKEHREMLDRISERRWRIVEGLIFAVAGGIVALVAQFAAKTDAPVVNISPPNVTVTTPPVNVTVEAPQPMQPLKNPGTK